MKKRNQRTWLPSCDHLSGWDWGLWSCYVKEIVHNHYAAIYTQHLNGVKLPIISSGIIFLDLNALPCNYSNREKHILLSFIRCIISIFMKWMNLFLCISFLFFWRALMKDTVDCRCNPPFSAYRSSTASQHQATCFLSGGRLDCWLNLEFSLAENSCDWNDCFLH